MNGRFLLDTNVVVALFGDESSVVNAVMRTHELDLVSRDEDFNSIDDLRCLRW